MDRRDDGDVDSFGRQCGLGGVGREDVTGECLRQRSRSLPVDVEHRAYRDAERGQRAGAPRADETASEDRRSVRHSRSLRMRFSIVSLVNVCVYGLWHLGSVTAASLASLGHDVVGLDLDAATVADLGRGVPPVAEPGLGELVRAGLEQSRLRFTTDPADALSAADVLWITFDTPVDDDDNADVDAVLDAAEEVFPLLRDDAFVLVSSQLPVGSVAELERRLQQARPGTSVAFGCSPENLRLGRALEAFLRPERVIVGVRDARRPRPGGTAVPRAPDDDRVDVGRVGRDGEARGQRVPRNVDRVHERGRRHLRTRRGGRSRGGAGVAHGAADRSPRLRGRGKRLLRRHARPRRRVPHGVGSRPRRADGAPQRRAAEQRRAPELGGATSRARARRRCAAGRSACSDSRTSRGPTPSGAPAR